MSLGCTAMLGLTLGSQVKLLPSVANAGAVSQSV